MNHASTTGTNAECGRALVGLLASVTVLLSSAPVTAQVAGYDAFKVEVFTQAGPVPPVSPDGYFFAARIFAGSVFDRASASVQLPNATSYALNPAPADASVYQFASGLYANQVALSAAFPAGTYTYTLEHPDLPNTPQTGVLDLPAADLYAGSVPFFSNYSAMQGLNSAQAFNFSWNPFVPNGAAGSVSETFLRLSATGGGASWDFNVSGENYVLAGATLVAATTYTATLYFSTRSYLAGAGFDDGNGPGATSLLGFDRATSVSFTTAVPEPSAWALLLMGLVFCGLAAQRRRAAAA